MGSRINRKIGRYVFMYLWGTYIIYLLLLPLKGHIGNLEEWRTILFLFFSSIAFYLGCRNTKISTYLAPEKRERHIDSTHVSIGLILLITISLLYLSDMLTYGIAVMSLNVGENYVGRLEAEVTTNSLWGQLNTLSLPFRIIAITYCTLKYKYLNTFARTLFFLIIFVLLITSVFRGVQVGVGNVLIYLIVPLFFVMYKGNKMKKFREYLLLGLLVFIAFFVMSQLSRANAYDVQLSDKYSDNFISDIFGNRIGGGMLSLLSYFSHGYRGLNYALQLPFEWTYGYGGSRALNEYLNQYLHIQSMYNDTYPMRVSAVFGYDCEMSWPTAFAWWASDFSFPGVVVLMYFLGILVCKVVNDAFNSYSVISISFLCQLVILIIFMPLNNQALQARDSLLATVLLFFIWIIK